MIPHKHPRAGLSLFELSIAFVIIALITGGVLLGTEMLQGAKSRAIIREKMNWDRAVATFMAKYDYLPGDISNPTPFGGVARTGTTTTNGFPRGNGDGIVANGTLVGGYPYSLLCGETVMFWSDLFHAGFINDKLDAGTDGWNYDNTCVPSTLTVADLGSYIPRSAIGDGYFWHVPGAWGTYDSNTSSADDNPYFDVVNNLYYVLTSIASVTSDGVISWGGAQISTHIAHQVDIKIDDGSPIAGQVLAWRQNSDNRMITYIDNSNGYNCTMYPDTTHYNLTGKYNGTKVANECGALSFRAEY